MVHFVGAGPGAPDLITRRGAALLQTADCIIYAGSRCWGWPKPAAPFITVLK